jgi:hypothetical protein
VIDTTATKTGLKRWHVIAAVISELPPEMRIFSTSG